MGRIIVCLLQLLLWNLIGLCIEGVERRGERERDMEVPFPPRVHFFFRYTWHRQVCIDTRQPADPLGSRCNWSQWWYWCFYWERTEEFSLEFNCCFCYIESCLQTKRIRQLYSRLEGWILFFPKNGCPVGWGCRIHRLLLCWGVRPPTHKCPWYDTKQSDGEVPVMLEL